MDSKTLKFKWTVSKGRDTYGYNICTLYVDGQKASRCNGGGYDMKGTCLGDWIAKVFADRLLQLKPENMPTNSHWQRSENPRRLCRKVACLTIPGDPYLSPDALICPNCGGETDIDNRDGKTIDDGHYFYGLSYHDPHYNPGKATIGKDCLDRTFGNSEGETVEQAEAEGKSFGLERYQAFYSASSKIPTERHTVPLIDGATGFESVQKIARAIGVELEYHNTKSKNLDLWTAHISEDWKPAATKDTVTV